MSPALGALRSVLPVLAAALPAVILFVTVLSIPLAAAPDLQLSTKQLNGWIMVLYGLPGLLSLGLALRYRQPLTLTGNVFAIIFVTSLEATLSYPEIIGASMVAGAIVLLVTAVTTPHFSIQAIATVTPAFVVLITLQSNLRTLVYLRSQGYQPPERAVNTVCGFGTLAGSLIGPTAISMPLPMVPLVAGPEAGERAMRHRAAYIATAALVLIAILAGVAADLAAIIPRPLLLSLAGMALVGVLAGALQQVTHGPLLLGPLFAFAIALSQISLLYLNPFFWSLVGGTAISLLLERDEWKSLHNGATG